MIKIIPYSDKYKEKVISLILNIWEKEFDYKGVARPDIYNIPGFYQNDKDSNFWLALSDNELIGTIGLIKKSDNSAFLKRMAIKKEFRKQGLGEKLLQTVIQFADEHDIKTIYVGTVPENTEALKFYKSHGFKENNFVPEGIVVSDNPICLKLNL
ncbi:GNAT family N-acetyltransferase [Patescibacteria group bacterium]|nr:GNAT family N-acetyltransferase [Patescibacteria group bacterium]MBU1673873.1 GNAT family N-acetyltransferase [Patescibacteria group bacterium]MBU1963250.1 GNAT family N-acetyltransferase [Patescibacteria group bacterium]